MNKQEALGELKKINPKLKEKEINEEDKELVDILSDAGVGAFGIDVEEEGQ